MLNDLFTRLSVIEKLESGPFGPYLSDIATLLKAQNYSRPTIKQYMRNANAFGRWLIKNDIAVLNIDEATINIYLSSIVRRKRQSRPNGTLPNDAIGLRKLLQLLRTLNIVLPQQKSTSLTPIDQVVLEINL